MLCSKGAATSRESLREFPRNGARSISRLPAAAFDSELSAWWSAAAPRMACGKQSGRYLSEDDEVHRDRERQGREHRSARNILARVRQFLAQRAIRGIAVDRIIVSGRLCLSRYGVVHRQGGKRDRA